MVRNRSDSELWDRLYNGFYNEICKSCFHLMHERAEIGQPEPIPYIGPNFIKDEHRLMFVGIETYGNTIRKDFNETRYNPFEQNHLENLFFKRKSGGIQNSPFWNWVNFISTKVLSPGNPEEAFSRIAYSNLHKCQLRRKGSTDDDFYKPSYQFDEDLSRNCINKAGWIYREIDAIEARNVIIFAGRRYNGLLAKIFLGYDVDTSIRKFNYDKFDLLPNQRENWKDRDIFVHLRNGSRRFIVTNHPQGTPSLIRDEIVRIIKENDWSGSETWDMPKF